MGETLRPHQVIVGLGNPGKQYRLTRHNIGYLVAEAFGNDKKWAFKEDKRFGAYVAKGIEEGRTFHILMPTTYMNESGRAVRAYLDYYKLTAKDVTVVADDTALPFGRVRVRAVGGSGGHNGLKSLEAHIGSQYVRIRMGIDKNPPFIPLADYVLSSFNQEEFAKLPGFIEHGVAIIKRLLTDDIADVMNAVNTRLESKPVDLEKGQEIEHESS